GVQVPEDDLDNLQEKSEEGTLEIEDPQELLGSILLETFLDLGFLDYTNIRSKQTELKRSKEFYQTSQLVRAIWRTLFKKITLIHNTFFSMDSQSTPVVSAAKLPILNPNEFDL
nr:hypothetical protein [Tanacetum cinerariifolium]